LKEVAEKLHSRTAAVLVPSSTMPPVWRAPEGWIHTEVDFSTDLCIPNDCDVVRRAFREESLVFNPDLHGDIPKPLAACGIHSLIAVAIGYPRRDALLLICNSKTDGHSGRSCVDYTKADVELAVVMGRVISMDGVGKLIHGKRTQPDSVDSIWEREKPELLRSHPGWFVAYQDGERVALEPSVDELTSALDEHLGRPRRPCEFHHVVEAPAFRRGPSPRLAQSATRG